MLLGFTLGAIVPACGEGFFDCSADSGVVVAVDASCVFAKEVGVRVAVDGGQIAAMSRVNGKWEGGGVQDGAGVAAGHVKAGFIVGFL